jgi:hypothetical protein
MIRIQEINDGHLVPRVIHSQPNLSSRPKRSRVEGPAVPASYELWAEWLYWRTLLVLPS